MPKTGFDPSKSFDEGSLFFSFFWLARRGPGRPNEIWASTFLDSEGTGATMSCTGNAPSKPWQVQTLQTHAVSIDIALHVSVLGHANKPHYIITFAMRSPSVSRCTDTKPLGVTSIGVTHHKCDSFCKTCKNNAPHNHNHMAFLTFSFQLSFQFSFMFSLFCQFISLILSFFSFFLSLFLFLFPQDCSFHLKMVGAIRSLRRCSHTRARVRTC